MCDTMIASKFATKCGYTIFGKNSDRSPNEPQPMIFSPAADHEPGSMVKTTRIEVEQAPHTYATLLSKPSWIWGAEIGINEKGVVIGNEAVISKDMSTTDVALLGMDVLRIALERADSAKKAVEVIGEMMEKYGQGGNCSFDGTFHYDNAYLVADSDEIWHVETAGKHIWVAKKINLPAYSISNYLSLNEPDLMHADTIRHAQEAGYKVGDPFNWQETYADWESLSHSGQLRRVCSLQQVTRHGQEFVVEDMLRALRSHHANDEWTDGMHCVCMHAKNPVYPNDIDCQTTNSMIAVMIPGDNLILAPGMSTPCIAPFQPFWFDVHSDRQVFAYDHQEEAIASWMRRESINRAILAGKIDVDAYRAEMHEMESRWLTEALKIAKKDRQAFVDRNAQEAEAFFDRWIAIAEKAEAKPMGDEGFQNWWGEKNAALGQDKRIAY